eukprot:CAMPEP_0178990560 /NCGR_PEP_ID=MMETSP0795-20121207/5026_1 /TAXON_ID=88552 /ORGANISM="Amoebophrya sp., Strain Ameob2" /LENGTH=589 /DNA_ID=CAMNT_0020682143 /DNA_START=26 /DNA_END=1795 /DNA_ORIENTATION=-
MLASQQIRRPLLVGLLASSAGMAAARVQTKTVTDDGDVVFSPESTEVEENGLPKVADGAASTPLSSSTVQVHDSKDEQDKDEEKNKKTLSLTDEFGAWKDEDGVTHRSRADNLMGSWLMTTFHPPYRYFVPKALADAGQEVIAEYSKLLAYACKNETETFYFVAQAMAEVYMVLTTEPIDDDYGYGQFQRLIKTVHRFQNDDWKMFKGQRMGKHAGKIWGTRYTSWGESNWCWQPCVGAMKAANGAVESRYREMSRLDKEIAFEEMVSDHYVGDVVPVHPNDTGTADDINRIYDPRKKAKAIRKTLKQFVIYYNKLLEVLFDAVKSRVAEELSTQVKKLPKEQDTLQEDSEMATASATDSVAELNKVSDRADKRREAERKRRQEKWKQENEEGHHVQNNPVLNAINAEDYEDYEDHDYYDRSLPPKCKMLNMQMYKLGRVMAVVHAMLSPDPEQNSARTFLMQPLALKKVRELGKVPHHDCGKYRQGGKYNYARGIDDVKGTYVWELSWNGSKNAAWIDAGKKHLEKIMNNTKLELDAKKSWTMMKMLGRGFQTLDTLIKHALETAKDRGQAPGAQKCEASSEQPVIGM